jgi:hypothetical protein
MIHLSEKEADQQKVDGCPVVVMHDEARDLGYLLEAMFHPFVAALSVHLN